LSLCLSAASARALISSSVLKTRMPEESKNPFDPVISESYQELCMI
jgi:hypothetical protein